MQPAPVSSKTALIGASGFVGRHLLRAYRALHPDCVGTSFSREEKGLVKFDIRRPDLSSLGLESSDHRAVIICSAKPNISYCEDHREEAYDINVRGTLELARQIARTSMQVIFLSSDYVFDGRSGSFDDDAPVAPSTEYGRQKVEVEKEIAAMTPNHLILRISKVYGTAKGDGTLLDEVAAAMAAGRKLRFATDQIVCPTFVEDLVPAILAVQQKGLRGTMNICSPEAISRYDAGMKVCRAMGLDGALLEPIRLYDIAAMKGRPLDTSMRCSRLEKEVGAKFTPLEENVRIVAAQWRR